MLLGGRWVYKTKTDSKGNIVRYKARWVAQGYNQVLGIDYLETFSTTIRPETYRLFLALALQNGWIIRQYDVKLAFIHSPIDKEIYIIQPIGFEKGYNKVCKLKKALYGLKQSPRLWYEFLSKILKAIGFITLPYDQGAFVHPIKGVVILCHVDDFLALGENKAIMNSVLEEVSLKVKLQALGEVSTFLGIEFSLEKHERIELNNKPINGYKSLRLHQAKYVRNMLKRFGKEHLTPVSTPVQEGVKL